MADGFGGPEESSVDMKSTLSDCVFFSALILCKVCTSPEYCDDARTSNER